jgi:quinol-cytochrome oxidoreductase complex cytochrome b subunit
MFMFQTLKYLPAEILGVEGELVGIVAFGFAAVVLLLMPVLDGRSTNRSVSRAWSFAAWGALVYILVLTWLGYNASPTS